MFQFIESIKVDNLDVFLVNLHQKRIEETFEFHHKKCEINILEVYKKLKHNEKGLFKLRIEYNFNNQFETQIIPYVIPKIETFELVENNLIDYNFKSANREKINEMKAQSPASEIIIVKNKQITDSSFSNLLFLKDDVWFTPISYLLNGVQRQNLLLKKKIKITEISLNNISEFSHFKLINALNNFEDSHIHSIDKIINLPIVVR